ncbi:MAG TPA: dethiobiotin synthase [Gallionellaceae bacterium]|nr:dethiobiotin synthase [Gallionellaceae bacterium]
MNYFVTGTDTGVGKTLASCALLHAFAAQGKRVAGMKPVAAGCDEDGLNEDVKNLRAATNILATLGQINPYSFIHPVAPHIAAYNAGVRINFDRILESYYELESQAELVIVEGAGGFQVPLNDTQDSADLTIAFGLPVIVVVGMRLGCLNHALLTVRAINDCGLKCAGWVANVLDPGMAALDENILALQQRIDAPLLGIMPHQATPDAREIAKYLNISLLDECVPCEQPYRATSNTKIDQAG